MNNERGITPSQRTHKMLATLSGAIGGAFGLPALAVELPVSTTIILRSVADIARGQGENIREIETQLACIEVFALGGPARIEGGADAGYYATRAALAHAVSNAAQYIAQKGIVEEGAPVIVKLISKVATRFSGPVLEKFAAQSIPVIGAAGGAGRKPRLHQSLSRYGKGPFHRPPTRTQIWRGRRSARIPPYSKAWGNVGHRSIPGHRPLANNLPIDTPQRVAACSKQPFESYSPCSSLARASRIL